MKKTFLSSIRHCLLLLSISCAAPAQPYSSEVFDRIRQVENNTGETSGSGQALMERRNRL